MKVYIKLILNKIKQAGLLKTGMYCIAAFFYPIYRKIYLEFVRHSYSQKQEDLIIDRLLNYPKTGFYIDIGANDPVRLNNTKRFYDRGWTGINIEPNYIKYNKLQSERSRDINLNIALSDASRDDLIFYIFDADAISTLSKDQARYYQKVGYKILEERKIITSTLQNIFETYIKSQPIDFLSIDTEGFDLIILKSNDWEKYRPNIIIIESSELDDTVNKASVQDNQSVFFQNIGYRLVSQTTHFGNLLNSIYIDTWIDHSHNTINQ